jgi:hypothetical protein
VRFRYALDKKAYVNLGRYTSKSRPWTVGTANVGECKSHSMRDATIDVQDAMYEVGSAFTADAGEDRRHYQQSGTTASAVNKAQDCESYLRIICSDAWQCLSLSSTKGNPCDPTKHVDLEYCLDAAHGDEFSHRPGGLETNVSRI